VKEACPSRKPKRSKKKLEAQGAAVELK